MGSSVRTVWCFTVFIYPKTSMPFTFVCGRIILAGTASSWFDWLNMFSSAWSEEFAVISMLDFTMKLCYFLAHLVSLSRLSMLWLLLHLVLHLLESKVCHSSFALPYKVCKVGTKNVGLNCPRTFLGRSEVSWNTGPRSEMSCIERVWLPLVTVFSNF